MFVHKSPPRMQKHNICSLLNWESDIEDVSVEECNTEEDPTGFRVVFVKEKSGYARFASGSYSIGASLLQCRLDRLRNAGFDAPMTQKAINIIDQGRLKVRRIA